MRLSYELINRLLMRSEEVATEPSAAPVVKNIYEIALKPKADAYRSSYDAIAPTTSTRRKKENEANAALGGFEALYKSARSATLAVDPTKVLPETLSAQPTDTDKLYAIKTLVAAVKHYAGQVWADELLKGEFGQKSAEVIGLLEDVIEAGKAASKAVNDRAAAAEPAYKAFVAFRRVVRDTLGPRSKQYRRLHVRSAARGATEGEAEPEVKTEEGGKQSAARGATEGEVEPEVKTEEGSKQSAEEVKAAKASAEGVQASPG